MKIIKIIISILLCLPVLLIAEDSLTHCYRASRQLPITVVITSFNNKNWYKDNLDSVFKQNYTNYKILYIDDCSTDGTAHLVSQYTQEQKQTHRLRLIKNKRWLSQMANHYYAVHQCPDEEIIVHLDGDDKLAHPNVLSFINTVYQDPNVWITFGNYSTFPNALTPPRITQQELTLLAQYNTFRDYVYTAFPYIHLRTFRAWLFKCIKLQDLILNSSFVPMSPAPDVAFMLPMLEMAGSHSRAIDHILYLYNLKNPLTQFTLSKENVIKLVITLLQWPKYTPLEKPKNKISTRYIHSKADIIVLAHTLSSTLLHCLYSLNKLLHNKQNIVVLMPIQEKEKFHRLKPSLLKSIPTLKTCFYTHFSFKQDLLDILVHSTPHVVLSSPTILVTKAINLNQCIRELEKTGAYAFHLKLPYPLDNNLDKLHVPITQNIIAWQRDYTQAIWNTNHKVSFILYRSRDITQYIQKLAFNNLQEFKQLWPHHTLPARTVELSFK